MMSLQAYLAFLAACIALALLPGPIVTLVIANGLRHGTRAALTNVAGAQAGLAIVIGIVAVGLTSLMATMGYWFDWVRFCRRRLSGLARHQADLGAGRGRQCG
ncbi:threonine/homoserine/homoserine lactone efflux protein [Bradyrhizobium sp. GM22.5]